MIAEIQDECLCQYSEHVLQNDVMNCKGVISHRRTECWDRVETQYWYQNGHFFSVFCLDGMRMTFSVTSICLVIPLSRDYGLMGDHNTASRAHTHTAISD